MRLAVATVPKRPRRIRPVGCPLHRHRRLSTRGAGPNLEGAATEDGDDDEVQRRTAGALIVLGLPLLAWTVATQGLIVGLIVSATVVPVTAWAASLAARPAVASVEENERRQHQGNGGEHPCPHEEDRHPEQRVDRGVEPTRGGHSMRSHDNGLPAGSSRKSSIVPQAMGCGWNLGLAP